MKISEIRAVTVELAPNITTKPRVESQVTDGFISPMRRYPEFRRADWSNRWRRTVCVVTAEDGTWGMGVTINSDPVNSIINDHFGQVLTGQNCMATEKLWDIMRRISSPYHTAGMASYAISAVDNALWDLKGKILGKACL